MRGRPASSSDGPGITAVVLTTKDGDITVSRSDGRLATLSSPGQPDRPVALKRRDLDELLVGGAAPARPRRHLRRDREADGAPGSPQEDGRQEAGTKKTAAKKTAAERS